MDLRKVIGENPLLAIMRNVPVDITLDYAKAIIDGGVNFFEVALNSPYALDSGLRLLNFSGRHYA